MKSFAFHSYKGGTGKTFLSTNLAVLYAQRGKTVCLLDFDFRAPSINAFFNFEKAEFTLNEVLDGDCQIGEAIVNTTEDISQPGRLYVGFADPSTEAISAITAKERKWQMKALRVINTSKQALSEKFKIDYLIFDTSPGFQYSSVNALLSSDVDLIVTTPDKSDINGTKELIEGVYEPLQQKTGIIINKVPTGIPAGDIDPKTMEKFSSIYKYSVIEMMPCSCDVLILSGESIFVLKTSDHPLAKKLASVAEKLEGF